MFTIAQSRKNLQRIALASSLAAAFALTGCSADFSHVSATSGPTTIGGNTAVGGSVFGGQQPVNGATVQLWVAGNTGYGLAPTALGSAVTTNSNGGFTLGSYTCPSNAYVYITAAGGDPQIGSGSNSSIAMVSALGPCSGLSSTTFIQINEVTTIAAVWALAPFSKDALGSAALSSTTTTPTFAVGTSSSNLQGLANAMSVANILASTTTGASPGSNTSGNVSNVEYWQVNTLADILALCVNSSGVASSTCSPVISSINTSGGMSPTDTLQVALYLAQNPTKSTALLSQVTGTPPFVPTAATINDWTIGYNIPTGTADTRWIAIDQFGNAWVTTSGTSMFELSPTGNILANPNTYSLGGSNVTFATAYEVALDTANNPWVTDETKPAIVEMPGSNAAGVAPSSLIGTGISTSAVSTGLLEGLSVDGSNNVWTSINGSHVVGLLSGAYSTLVTGGTTTGSPFMIASDMSNQTRFGNSTLSGGGSFLYSLNSGGCSTALTVGGATATSAGGSISMTFTAPTTISSTAYAAGAATPLNYLVDSACANTTNIPANTSYSPSRVFMSVPYGIAFDNNNSMWVVNQNYTSSDVSSGKYSLSKMVPQNYGANSAFTGTASAAAMTFTSVPGAAGGLNAPYYLAMDGASAAWVANSAGAGVSAFTNAGAAISPSTGFSGGTCTTSPCSTSKRTYVSARGIAVDGSGNVWVANTGATYVTVLVGAATPTVTPLSLGIKNGTLASQP